MADAERQQVIQNYLTRLQEHNDLERKVKERTFHSVREENNKLNRDFDKTEEDLKALQNTGQIIGEVLKQVDDDRCRR